VLCRNGNLSKDLGDINKILDGEHMSQNLGKSTFFQALVPSILGEVNSHGIKATALRWKPERERVRIEVNMKEGEKKYATLFLCVHPNWSPS